MMGRSPCCDENGLKKGPWTTEEDEKLVDYIKKHGHGSWRALPKLAGLNRCGKSCRLRWTNYLRPDIKRGKFTEEEEQIIIKLHAVLGNKWSTIAQRLSGRTDNEIKNYWNTHLKKKLLQRGIDPVTHRPRTDHFNLLANLPQLLATSNFSPPMNPFGNALGLQNTDFTQLAKIQLLHNLFQVLSTSPHPTIEAPSLFGSLPLHDHHQLLYDQFPKMNSEFEGLGDIPIDFAPNPSQMLPTSSNLDVYKPSQNVQTTTELNVLSGHKELDYSNQFQTDWPTENSLPTLVSDSPDCSTMNQMEHKTNSSTDVSKPSSSSTTFDAWGELMEDETGDFYWKGILDHASSPSWPIS